jgi:hypothetical protein
MSSARGALRRVSEALTQVYQLDSCLVTEINILMALEVSAQMSQNPLSVLFTGAVNYTVSLHTVVK